MSVQRRMDRFPTWKIDLDARSKDVLDLPGVMSIGIGGRTGDEHVVVLVEDRNRDLVSRIQSMLAEFKVEVQQSKPLRLF